MIEERSSSLLFRATLIGALLGLAATIYLLFGLAGYVASAWLNLFVVGSLAAAALFFLFLLFETLSAANSLGRGIGGVIVFVLAAEILLSLVPPTARDELTHHLAIPRLYARAGRIFEVSMAPYAYFPMLLDMLYTPWVYWGYDSVPKLIHCFYGFLTGLALCAYLSRRMNSVYGLLGFFFFISVPVVLRLNHWAYVDLGTSFYSTASLLCLLRWREEQTASSWLALAGASMGFAASTKPNGFLAALILVFLMAFILAGATQKSAGKMARQMVLFIAMAALPVAPWLVKNWLQTGNPFFPLLAGFFPGHNTGDAQAAVTFAGLGIFAKRELLYGESWWQIAALPLRLFISGRDDNPQYFDGVLSPILILFLPWAFKGKWREEKKLLAAFAVLYLAFALFLVDMRARYVLPVVPPLVALMAYGVFNAYLRIKHPGYLFAVLAVFALLHGFYLWRYFQAVGPLDFLAGRESRNAYLTRVVPEYSTFDYINHELPPTAKIYLLFVGRRAYYCERDYIHDGGELPGLLVSAIQSARDSTEIGKTLERKGITHLMVREGLLVRFLNNNLSPNQHILWSRFVAEHLHARFRDRGYALYQLDG
ncbi:MAG: ArnT family glycosyltransferase [Alphaproteobacteria bacterium]